jgi:hypothetical protein
MPESATYLLRTAPELKAAAKALTEVAFTEPSLSSTLRLQAA